MRRVEGRSRVVKHADVGAATSVKPVNVEAVSAVKSERVEKREKKVRVDALVLLLRNAPDEAAALRELGGGEVLLADVVALARDRDLPTLRGHLARFSTRPPVKEKTPPARPTRPELQAEMAATPAPPTTETPTATRAADRFHPESLDTAALGEAVAYCLERLSMLSGPAARATKMLLDDVFATYRALKPAMAQAEKKPRALLGPLEGLVGALDRLVKASPHFIDDPAAFDALKNDDKLASVQMRDALGRGIDDAFRALSKHVDFFEHDDLAFSSYDTALHLHDGDKHSLFVALSGDAPLSIPIDAIAGDKLYAHVSSIGGSASDAAPSASWSGTGVSAKPRGADAHATCAEDEVRHAIIRGDGPVAITLRVRGGES